MDENKFTYPEGNGICFSEAEKKRWDRNLKKLEKKWAKKFGGKPKRSRKQQEQDEQDD